MDWDGCALCRGRRIPYDALARVGPYKEPLRTLILAYKYRCRRELAPVLGRLLAERVALAPWADLVELVVPVPLHWSRRIGRGFDQAQALAHEVVRAARRGRIASPENRPLMARRLLRVRPTAHQTRLPPSRRLANVRGAFAVRGRASAIAGKHVLLVDDVLTSGATMGECARMLKRAGAASVFAAVLAVAGRDEPGPW